MSLIIQGTIKNISIQQIKGNNWINKVAFFIFLSKSLLFWLLFLPLLLFLCPFVVLLLPKNISSNGAAVLTPKQKRESIYSQKIPKNKKPTKDNDKKSNKAKNKKSQENTSEKEEDFENINISETVLSELIINDKILKKRLNFHQL